MIATPLRHIQFRIASRVGFSFYAEKLLHELEHTGIDRMPMSLVSSQHIAIIPELN